MNVDFAYIARDLSDLFFSVSFCNSIAESVAFLKK